MTGAAKLGILGLGVAGVGGVGTVAAMGATGHFGGSKDASGETKSLGTGTNLQHKQQVAEGAPAGTVGNRGNVGGASGQRTTGSAAPVVATKTTTQPKMPTQEKDYFLKLKDAGDDKFLNTNHAPKEKGFHLKTYNCSKTFFPGARMPKDMNEVKEEKNGSIAVDQMAKMPEDSLKGGKNTKACALSLLQSEERLFIFKSEMAMKNDRAGMVFWMAAKNSSINGSMQVQLIYRLAFYTKGSDGKWKIHSAFGWGFEDANERIKAESARFNFPQKKTETVSGAISKNSGGFAGVWKTGSGSEKTITLTPDKLSDKTNGEVSFSNYSLMGYEKKADVFFHEKASGTGEWEWRRFKNGGQVQTVDVKDHINKWKDIFNWDQKGTWNRMHVYCPGSGKSEDVCAPFALNQKR